MSHTPPPNCPLCPRLCGFREDNKRTYPHFFNAPVPSFGELDARLLIVGLAPGLQGANATGRPFTGDYAGDILYASLLKNGFATGSYSSPRGEVISGAYKDNLTLTDCRITNAVRCVPPENKPEPSEIKACNAFLRAEIAAMPNLTVILSLGLVSHGAVLRALGLKASAATFAHGAIHRIQEEKKEKNAAFPESRIPNPESLFLLNSYHCSRYNINTGRLTAGMFDAVVARAKALMH